jgi:hypothetical protein
MEAMKDRDGKYSLRGIVHIDDAYFGGELNGGKARRGSENKVPFVAALEMSDENRPIHLRLNRVSGFTSDAIAAWSLDSLAPGSVVFSDGLACFRAVGAANCEHVPIAIGGRKPKDVPLFQWLNTIMGNVKTALSGTHHAFNYRFAGLWLQGVWRSLSCRDVLSLQPPVLSQGFTTASARGRNRLRTAAEAAAQVCGGLLLIKTQQGRNDRLARPATQQAGDPPDH